jgi:hypothetical protein
MRSGLTLTLHSMHLTGEPSDEPLIPPTHRAVDLMEAKSSEAERLSRARVRAPPQAGFAP